MKILQGKADFYTFKTLPWSLWILSSITLSLAIFMHYFLWYVAKKQEYENISLYILDEDIYSFLLQLFFTM